MNSSAEWSNTTIQYRLNLPYTLHSVSPALSALHVSRTAALHPEASAILHPSHCPRCGTYHFSGDHATHPIGPSTRRKQRCTMSSRPKPFQRKCRLCGFSIDACTSPSSASRQLPTGSLKSEVTPTLPSCKEIESPLADILRPVEGAIPTTVYAPPISSLPSLQSQPKSSHTKTSTLKDMLSRDRQREEALRSHKKRKEGHEGLEAFLKEL